MFALDVNFRPAPIRNIEDVEDVYFTDENEISVSLVLSPSANLIFDVEINSSVP